MDHNDKSKQREIMDSVYIKDTHNPGTRLKARETRVIKWRLVLVWCAIGWRVAQVLRLIIEGIK